MVELTFSMPQSPIGNISRIRVLRRTASRFVFGKHYASYFESMKPGSRDAYSGCKIERKDDGKVVCRDANVRAGATYVYWIRVGRSRTQGPFAVKVRDPGIWWPRTEILRRMRALARRFPDLIEYTVFGKTASHKSLSGLRVGSRTRCVALTGLVHAGESGPELMIPALERLVVEDPDLLKKTGVAILPAVNGDERERQVDGCPWYLRRNPRGVDINRNFDADWEVVNHMYGLSTDDPNSGTYRGVKPESEPETRAVVNFVKMVRPRVVFNYHHLASICDCHFLGPRSAEGDGAYRRSCNAMCTSYTHGMYPSRSREPGLSFTTSPGSLPAWLYSKMKVPAFDVEGDRCAECNQSTIDRTDDRLLELFQERHYGGIRSVLQMLSKRK